MDTTIPIVKNPEMVFISIPEKPLLSRKETWKQTINNSYKNNISLGRTIHIYYQNVLVQLETYSKSLKSNPKVKKADIVNEESLLGYPNQLHIIYEYEEKKVNLYYDGIILLFRQELPYNVISLDEIDKFTNSNLQLRNLCLDISREIQIETRWIPDPFYIGSFDNINDFGIKTEADYPGLRITYFDKSYHILTNYGDKQEGTVGKEYNIYLANDKKKILERIGIDRLILHDLNLLLKEIEDTNKYVIDANEGIINSLKNMPSSIINIFERYSNWLKLKHIPNNLLSIDAYLPKQKLYLSLFDEFLKNHPSYVIVPSVILFDSSDPNRLMINARAVSHFFPLRYKPSDIELISTNGIIPYYAFLIPEINQSFNRILDSMSIAKKNLNDSVSIYSSNFGFDAILIAIASLVIPIFPFTNIYKLITEFGMTILNYIRGWI